MVFKEIFIKIKLNFKLYLILRMQNLLCELFFNSFADFVFFYF